MFIGEYNHNIDSKGRIAIPAKFRAMLEDGAVVTRGLDNCLFLYSKTEWAKEAEKFASLPSEQSKSRAYARLMLAGAMDLDFDNQGRVTLPEYLRKYALLSKKVVVAGLYDRLEIWDEDNWNKYKETAERDIVNIAEALGTDN